MDSRKFRETINAYIEDRQKKHKRFGDEQFGRLVGCSKSRVQQMRAGQIPGMELAIEVAMLCGLDLEETQSWWLSEKGRRPKKQRMRAGYSTRYTPQVFRTIRQARVRVCMQGITVIRKIRNCSADLRRLVGEGGQLKILLADRTSKSFVRRREDEARGDGDKFIERGLVTLRMDHEFCVSHEILKSLSFHARSAGRDGSVELRVFDSYPPPGSITIVDNSLAYRYIYRKKHEGEKNLVEMCWDLEDPLFRKIEDDFLKEWNEARRVSLEDLADKTFTLPTLNYLD